MTEKKAECTAFCPQCGADLYFVGGMCYCKNRECDYTCDHCKREAAKLHYSDEDEAKKE